MFCTYLPSREVLPGSDHAGRLGPMLFYETPAQLTGTLSFVSQHPLALP